MFEGDGGRLAMIDSIVLSNSSSFDIFRHLVVGGENVLYFFVQAFKLPRNQKKKRTSEIRVFSASVVT